MQAFVIVIISSFTIPVLSNVENIDLSQNRFSLPSKCKGASCTVSIELDTNNSTNITKAQLSGNPKSYDLNDVADFWLGFGLSKDGKMANSKMYLCQKRGNKFKVSLFNGSYHNILRDSETDLGVVESGYTNGNVTCKFEMKSEHFPVGALKMFYGMGPIKDDEVKMHKDTPKTVDGTVFHGVSSAISLTGTLVFYTLTMLMALV